MHIHGNSIIQLEISIFPYSRKEMERKKDVGYNKFKSFYQCFQIIFYA